MKLDEKTRSFATITIVISIKCVHRWSVLLCVSFGLCIRTKINV